jgi:hypothetical protein
MSEPNFAICRYVTVPISLASLGLGIAAAEILSPVLMFVAAGTGVAGVLSLALQKSVNGHSNGVAGNGAGRISKNLPERRAAAARR